MKALTVQQGWASLMFQASQPKDVENRTWPTKHRGDLLIHAGNSKKSIALTQAFCLQRHLYMSAYNNSDSLPLGAIVGIVEIVGCDRSSSSRWAMRDHWHWAIANPRKFREPIACKGSLSLWTPSAEILERVEFAIENIEENKS